MIQSRQIPLQHHNASEQNGWWETRAIQRTAHCWPVHDAYQPTVNAAGGVDVFKSWRNRLRYNNCHYLNTESLKLFIKAFCCCGQKSKKKKKPIHAHNVKQIFGHELPFETKAPLWPKMFGNKIAAEPEPERCCHDTRLKSTNFTGRLQIY